MGIISENSQLISRTETKYVQRKIASSEDRESVTVKYIVVNVSPQLNYVFIADILDYFNNSKVKNVSYFSKSFSLL